MVREYEIQAFERLQSKKIMRCVCDDLTASATVKILSINRSTISAYFSEFRIKILKNSIKEHSKEFGVFEHNVFELDESYFGACRIRGKRGRGVAGKTPVFGLPNRNGKVFVTVIPNCSKEALMPVIQCKILECSTIHTDGWSAYEGLILNGYDHCRVYHNQNEFTRSKSHVNWIEFWSFAKRRRRNLTD